MRIGICCYPTYGGSGAIATELGLTLAERGHEVHFLSYARPARLSDFHPGVTFHRVQVTSYPLFRYPPYDLALASLMREVAETRQLDVLHVHYAIPHAVTAALARDMLGSDRPRIVTTLHGTDITIVGNERAYIPAICYGLARSDVVTAVSQWLRDETIAMFNPATPVEVVPNFVDPQRFRPRERSACRDGIVPAGRRVISHVSNFRPVKRMGDVIEIFAGLARTVDAHLLLAGAAHRDVAGGEIGLALEHLEDGGVHLRLRGGPQVAADGLGLPLGVLDPPLSTRVVVGPGAPGTEQPRGERRAPDSPGHAMQPAGHLRVSSFRPLRWSPRAK